VQYLFAKEHIYQKHYAITRTKIKHINYFLALSITKRPLHPEFCIAASQKRRGLFISTGQTIFILFSIDVVVVIV